jgi:hypothetical protein
MYTRIGFKRCSVALMGFPGHYNMSAPKEEEEEHHKNM